MFHLISDNIKFLGGRLVALITYMVNFKIIFYSILVLIFDFIYFKVLRNIQTSFSWKYVLVTLGIFLGLRIGERALRNIEERFCHKKKQQKWCGIFLFLINISTSVVIISAFMYIRIKPVIVEEQNLSKQASSFTDIFEVFEGEVVTEATQKYTYDVIEVKLTSPIELDEKVLQKQNHKILIKIKKYEKLRVGEVCTFRGTLKQPENFEDFAYQDYLKNNDIYLLSEFPEINCNGVRKGFGLRNNLIDFKEKLNQIIERNLKEPQSSLLMGIIFGQDRLFSKEFESNIRIAGVSHIVAASGYNITILILASSLIFKWLPYKLRIILQLLIIWGFCILSGLSPSILRAGIMATITLIALLLGRQSSIHISLPLAACIFVLITPKIIFNTGFQLSALSTFGLIYLQPTLCNISEKILKKKNTFLEETIFTTLSCTLFTIPISIAVFKTFTIWSVLANCLILPIIESTLFLGVLGICFSSFSFLISKLFFEIVNIQLKYFELVVNEIGKVNWGYWTFENIPNVIPIVIVLALILTCIYFYPIKNEDRNYYLKVFA